MTAEVEWTPGRTVTVRVIDGDRLPVVLLAHGAGVDQDHPAQTSVRDGLATRGFGVVTFNYPYKEAGRGRPDRPDVLLACHRSVVEWVVGNVASRVVLVGRSMGGRIGTMLVAGDSPAAGAVALAYPLHPIGKPDRLRVEHLPAIRVPVLMVVGDRDPMCTMDLYDRHVRDLPHVATVVIRDGDHSFRVRRSSGRTNDEAREEVLDAVAAFLTSNRFGVV